MSDQYPPGISKNAKGGTIILTKNDREKIRNGEWLEFHFHGLQFPQGRVTFFVSLPGKYPDENSISGKMATEVGGVCPLIISLEQLDKMEKSLDPIGRIVPSDPPYEIIVATSEAWKEVRKK